MIYLHKLLPLLLSPLVLAFAAVLYGRWRRRWRWAVGAVVMLYALSTPVVSDALLRAVENQALRQPVAAQPRVDAVVVLSGMVHDVAAQDGLAREWTDADRFFAGLALMQAGRADRLVFTRGLLPWGLGRESEGEWLQRQAVQMGVDANAIVLPAPIVQNTADEAQAVAQRLRPAGWQRILLVTSAYHMPRAQALFEQAGLVVHPFPVDFKVEARDTTVMDFLPSARALQGSDLAVREWVGRAYYQLRALAAA